MPRKSRNNAETKNHRGTTRKIAKRIFSGENIRNILGVVFVVLGFVFLYKLPVIRSTPQNKEPIVASSEFKKVSSDSNIVRILIPGKSIDLVVRHAKIIKGYWETSEGSASHGEGSANPGERGNVVVFAHARVGLFYNLKDVKEDDIVYIFTKDRWYRYKVSEIKAVYPNQIETVGPTDKEVLTLFTCSGFFDEKRLIVKAYPVNSSK